jgi:hypothetical protein
MPLFSDRGDTNKMKNKFLMSTALAAFLAFSGNAFAFQATKAPSTATKATKTTTPPPSDADIATAKTAGKVWVNTSTKVYHKSDSEFYGKTKQGKFMAESDATAAGFRAAKTSTPKKTSGATKK